MADYAGVGSRIVAVLIDHIILLIVMAIIALPLGLSAALFSVTTDYTGLFANIAAWTTLMVLNVIIWIGYFTYFEGTSGQTFGKKLMHIKVTREDGNKPTYAEALIRTILRIIDGIGLYILGLIIVLVSEKKQRLGDMAAKTIVVKA